MVDKRVRINYAKLDALIAGCVDGLAVVGQAIIDDTRPGVPDEPPLGVGLVNTGGYVVYVDGHKVAGTASIRLGRRNPMNPPRKGITLYVGYDFPARFLHNGTIHISPRPFFAPHFFADVRGLAAAVRPAVDAKLRSVP